MSRELSGEARSVHRHEAAGGRGLCRGRVPDTTVGMTGLCFREIITAQFFEKETDGLFLSSPLGAGFAVRSLQTWSLVWG